ncbi:hypothetical protein ACFLSV_05310 [Bacteroidota bacterium]
MNKLSILAIFVFSFLTQTAFSQQDDDWIVYDDAVLIDSSNASSIEDFENTPESIVTYFYASKIKNDDDWNNVLPEEGDRSKRLNRKLKEYENWTFTKFKLVSKMESGESQLWIKIFMEIVYKGRVDSGTDEVTVELIDGKWVITSVPT